MELLKGIMNADYNQHYNQQHDLPPKEEVDQQHQEQQKQPQPTGLDASANHRGWLHLLLFTFAILLLQQKEVHLNVNTAEEPFAEAIAVPAIQCNHTAVTTADLTPKRNKTWVRQTQPKPTHTPPPSQTVSDNLGNTYSNMTYTGTASKSKSQKNTYLAKKQKQEAYVTRFSKVAQGEMKKYGIPASITLAQGLIESNAGESRLARNNNNHFGMKCFSQKCSKGHCSNFTDDSHKDFFRIYETAWESYRAHSILLTNKRYRRLFRLDKKDYKGWAVGLKKAGYATDPRYAQKLIHIIEELKLNRFD